MKKLILIILLLVIPIKVKASYCNYMDIAEYKNIASNISYSYEYEEIDDDVVFHVTLTNLDSKLYLVDSKKNTYNYMNDEMTIDARSGESLLFTVYATDKYCKKSLTTIRIQLPTYNKFYKDSICVGVENYNLCSKWSTHNLSYEDFVSNVRNYKLSIIPKDSKEETEDDNGILDFVIEFLIKYYYIVLPVIIIGCLIAIYFRNKKDSIYS